MRRAWAGAPGWLTALAAAGAGALALAPGALAHARPLGSTPADGAVLAVAPASVVIRFDDTVIAAPGAAAVRNGGESVLAGPERASGRVATIPLRPRLGKGDYTVRWRVLGDDGHLSEGLVAFAVGKGRAPPTAGLELLGSGPRWAFVLARWLLLAGTLLALGGSAFRLLVLCTARGRPHPADGALLVSISASFAVALAGSGLAIVAVPDSLHTRFGQAAVAGIGVSALGVALAEAGRSAGRWALASAPAALALAAVVVAGGHALDPPAGLRPLKVAVDLAHLGAAAIWIGGAVQVALLLPRLAPPERGPALRRFGVVAVAAVAVVAASGIGRAAFSLSSVGQAWSTGYGQALLVKSGLLLVALALAAARQRRRRHASTGKARVAGEAGGARRSLLAELGVLAGIVVAVAVLGDLRPGRDTAAGAAAGAVPTARTAPPLPPAAAVTQAREEGDNALALAVSAAGPGQLRLTASVVGPDRLGVDGLELGLGADGAPRPAAACGSGCYTVTVPAPPTLREVTVSLAGRALPPFAFPAWPPRPAAALVRRATAAFEQLRTLRYDERLASSPTNAVESHLRIISPDRFAYEIDGGGAGIVIGETRWDRFPGSPRWVQQQADRLSLPAAAWGGVPRNAFEIGLATVAGRRARIVTLLDPSLPAWFTVWIDERSELPLRLEMTAAAHFMIDRYGPFDAPVSIVPPAGG